MPTDPWANYIVGGRPDETITLLVHVACGALVGDMQRHEEVCTAPPREEPPFTGGFFQVPSE